MLRIDIDQLIQNANGDSAEQAKKKKKKRRNKKKKKKSAADQTTAGTNNQNDNKEDEEGVSESNTNQIDQSLSDDPEFEEDLKQFQLRL